MTSTHGHCLCGKVRVSFDPDGITWRGHCHCDSCRRACSAPMTTFFGVRNSAWRWTGEAPGVFRSSAGVSRYFCQTCGSPMGYSALHWPDETHFYAASLEDPSDFTPESHAYWSERLPWIHLNDDLPRHSDGSPGKTD